MGRLKGFGMFSQVFGEGSGSFLTFGSAWGLGKHFRKRVREAGEAACGFCVVDTREAAGWEGACCGVKMLRWCEQVWRGGL